MRTPPQIRRGPFAALGLLLLISWSDIAQAAAPATQPVAVEAKLKASAPEWTPLVTTVLTSDAANVAAPPLDQYGGRADRTLPSTGFFHVVNVDGRWTWVDPDGHPFISIGQCAVVVNGTANGKAALAAKFGDTAGWAKTTAALLRDAGFNTLGCWSDPLPFAAAGTPLPYCTQLDLMSAYAKHRGSAFQATGHTGYEGNAIPVFDPQFEIFADELAQKLIGPRRDDPFLLGHFSDNELPLSHGMLARYLKLPAGDAGRVFAEKWFADRRGPSTKPADDWDDDAFTQLVAERYYRICRDAIRKADPNHAYIGSRLLRISSRSIAIVTAAGKFCDVLSVNYYAAWTPDDDFVNRWLTLSGRPFMITEWYAKGIDSGMGNRSGAGWLVKTQADRGRFYQNFAYTLLHNPGCVGWHWFKYIDNDPTNATSDPSNLDSNKGIVSNAYEPYTPLVNAMHDLNRLAYVLRDEAPAATQPAATQPTN